MKISMLNRFLSTGIILNLFFASASLGTENQPVSPMGRQAIDAILATVADEIILVSDLQRAIAQRTQNQATLTADGKLSGKATVDDAWNAYEELLNQKVISIKCKEFGLQVGPDELEQEIKNYLQTQGATEEQLQAQLQADGVSYAIYQDEFRRSLELQRLVGRQIRPKISVSDEEIRGYYLQNSQSQNQFFIKMRSLVIDLPSELTEQQRQAKNEKILDVQKQIQQASAPALLLESFPKLVKLYSDDPALLKGGSGELPPKKFSELPASVKDQFSLQTPVGTVIGPINTGSSVFFFQLIGIETQNEKEFLDQKKKWEAKLFEIKIQDGLKEFLLAERSKIKVNRRAFTILKSGT